jgi:hypothetical protein
MHTRTSVQLTQGRVEPINPSVQYKQVTYIQNKGVNLPAQGLLLILTEWLNIFDVV